MTIIEIQDEQIARLLASPAWMDQSGHYRRVQRGARKAAVAKLVKLGFSTEMAETLARDAQDMAWLHRMAD